MNDNPEVSTSNSDITEALKNPGAEIAAWGNGTPGEEMSGPSLREIGEAQAKAKEEEVETKAPEETAEKESTEEVDADALQRATDFLKDKGIEFQVVEGKILYDDKNEEGVDNEALTKVMKGEESSEEETEEPEMLSWDDVKGVIETAVPGAVIAAEEGQEMSVAVGDYISELADRGDRGEQYTQLLQEIVESYPPFGEFLKQVMDPAAPVSPATAAAKAFKDVEALDPDESPEAWKEMVLAEAERKAQAGVDKTKAVARSERVERFRRGQAQAYTAFEKRMGKDFDYNGFLAEAASVIEGDPRTGKFHPDAPTILHRGIHFDALVKEKVDEALSAKLDEMRKGEKNQFEEVVTLTGAGPKGRRKLTPQEQTAETFSKNISTPPDNPWGLAMQGAHGRG